MTSTSAPAETGWAAYIPPAIRVWLSAYRVEVTLFVVAAVILAMFSGPRFFRQSAAPHSRI